MVRISLGRLPRLLYYRNLILGLVMREDFGLIWERKAIRWGPLCQVIISL